MSTLLLLSSNCYVIGVCGPSCSGKSTICSEIINKIKNIKGTTTNMVAILSQDVRR